MPDVYRLSFDFYSPVSMMDFWETFQAVNSDPDPLEGWDDCQLVHKDSLHDRGKHIHDFLVRGPGVDNGRPVTVIRTKEKESVVIV
jgi:hypothetical protein|tara:strand:+ start:1919 stop:2176 length:258 start_codon:yes stop_codon:yes gene_type:complete